MVDDTDLALFQALYGTTNPLSDLNSDGFVNTIDLAMFNALRDNPPGPAAP